MFTLRAQAEKDAAFLSEINKQSQQKREADFLKSSFPKKEVTDAAIAVITTTA